MSRAAALITISVAALLAGCDKAPRQPDPSIVEMQAFQVRVAKAKIAPSVILVSGGQCLDLAKPPLPWAFETARSATSHAVVISAKAAAVGIAPAAPGLLDDPNAVSDAVFVEIFPWAYPKDEWGLWHVASPHRIAANIRSGLFNRFSPWKVPARGWEAYRLGALPDAYLDASHVSQCRDFNPARDLVNCAIIPPEQDIMIFFETSEKSVPALPAIAEKLVSDVDKARRPC